MSGSWASLAASLILMWAAIATGFGLMRWVGARPSVGEGPLYALVLGLGVQGTALLVVSALGWMHPAVLWACVLVPAAGGRDTLARLRVLGGRMREVLLTLTTTERFAMLVVGGAVATTLFVGAAVPVTDWDSQMYHLRIPRLLLDEGRLHLPADGNHLAFLGLFQFLYLPLLAIGAEGGPAMLNAGLTASLGLAIAVTGHRFFSPRSGLLAAVALWGSSSLLLVGVTPRVDVALTAVLAITHLAVLRAMDDDAAWAIPVAALAGGVAIAMKYHALPYVAALGPLALWALWRRQPSPRDLARHAAVAASLLLVATLPWLAKNIVFFGAPFFPFFTEQRLVPFLADIAGSFAIPPDVPAEALRSVGRAREPISLGALLFRPASLSIELEAQHYTRNAIFFALPLVALHVRDRRLMALVLPGLLYLAFTLGWFNHTNPRYIIPALPMLALAATECLRRLAARLPDERRAARLLAALVVAIAMPALLTAGARLISLPRAQVALGLWQRETLLMREMPYATAKVADSLTPPDARILMLFEARGYYFTREVLQDNLLTNWPLLHALGATDRCLAGTGITHVLLNTATPAYYQRRGADLRAMRWDQFPAFAQRCLVPLQMVGTELLFRVR